MDFVGAQCRSSSEREAKRNVGERTAAARAAQELRAIIVSFCLCIVV